MNEKFFDLKKEKQDRMINAALKVFALNGYKHASTDTIVAEAEISKGLLFHYFGNKLGLYAFIYDYSVRFMKLELTNGVNESKDYFELRRQIELSKMQVLKSYPYMQHFLDRCKSEDVSEALTATLEQREIISQTYEEIMSRVDKSLFAADVDYEKLDSMLEYTIKGLMNERFGEAAFNPEMLYEEISDYLDMMKKLVYRKTNAAG